jgi:hypothetical protein
MFTSKPKLLPCNKRRAVQFIAAVLMTFAVTASVLGPGLAYSQSWSPTQPYPGFPRLTEFIGSVRNDRTDTLVGVYVPGVLALPVLQQPPGNAGYVSNQPETVTQFGLARDYGSIGLVAHNTHSGSQFYKLSPGQDVYLVYGDGRTTSFRIKESATFQALSPNSPYSNFVDLNSGKTLSASDLFLDIYAQPGRLVFLTCIEVNGVSTWGRLFIIAEPYQAAAELPEIVFSSWAIPE